jgi:hypothetical protein
MRIPEPAFVLVNAVIRTLLRSPLHSLMSKSVLVVSYKGRKSGRRYSTPVRYVEVDDCIRCFTSEQVQWWRNVKRNPAISLLVQGISGPYRAEVQQRDPVVTKQKLRHFLSLFPQDASYQNIRLDADKSLNEDDLEAASHSAIVVEFSRATAPG